MPLSPPTCLSAEAPAKAGRSLGMAGEWCNTTLGGFVTLQRGHDLTDSERRLGTVPVMGAAGQNGFHDTALVKGPGIVVGRSGASFGQVHYCETDFWPHNTGLYVTDFRGNNPRFAFYFLKALDFSRYNSGSAQPSLNRNFIYPIEVQVPPLDEQRAIAHILGTLDDKIGLNQRMNETLEAMARALFKSWFVDFDPVRAKAEGRNPGLPKPLADLFPDSFVDSELAEIPKGWRVTNWGALVSLEYGKGIRDYDRSNEAYPVYGTNGMIGSHSRPLCDHPGIIIGRKGAYRGVHFCSTPFSVIDTAFYVEPKESIELRWAYYELLRQDINSMDSGSAIPSTSREDFYNLGVLSPPFKVQQAFVELLNPIWARQEHNNRESITLVTLRDTLLPKLISGEVRVTAVKDLAEVTA
jgi:type I restriction enzyme S subunit